MPAVRLNQREWSATEAGSAFLRRGFSSGSLSSFFCFHAVLQFNLLALSTSAVRTRAISLVLGLSFYPLEQASKHGDLCNEQIRGQQRAV